MMTDAMGRSLVEAFGRVPDPRSRHGRRHPLPAMLMLATAALLSGARSLAAITQWGRMQSPEALQALGFTREQSPAIATLHKVLARVDADAVEAVVRGWAQAHLADGDSVLAVDGKAVRGTYGEQTPGLMVLAAFTHAAGQVLAQTGDRHGGP